MKHSHQFLAVFGVAAALLGAGCTSSVSQQSASTNAQEQPCNDSRNVSLALHNRVRTKKGKTDSLSNVRIESYANCKLTSPLKITGEARLWYFEASFPVELYDAQNRLIGSGPAQAKADWMTEDWVPFEAQFAFPDQPAGSTGRLLLKKDNPSGLPEQDDSFEITVTF